MKKIVSLLVVCALFISMSCSVFAESSVVCDNNSISDSNVQSKTLTREQYIKRLSELEKISIAEATKRVKAHDVNIDNNSLSINSLGGASTNSLPSGQYYAEFSLTETAGPGWSVEVGALCIVASGCGHSNFVSVDSSWSNAVGSGSHTWECFYKLASITDPSTLKLMTRGNLTITIGSSMSATLKSAFIDAGFSLSGTEYLRKTISISGTKNLY